ncbi:hypothetical protein F5883DRAFT_580916 [Diaporthe sp. PMI_573]|nr:hypothetical protein F5883DRAFT_580916 [Diaporthaceae sp. PMI_573]
MSSLPALIDQALTPSRRAKLCCTSSGVASTCRSKAQIARASVTNYTSDIERPEPEHDKAWQELVDIDVLRPHETKEFLRTTASPMERQTEEDKAMKAVQRAESEAKRIYVLTQEDPKRLRIPKAKRMSMLKSAQRNCLLQSDGSGRSGNGTIESQNLFGERSTTRMRKEMLLVTASLCNGFWTRFHR